MNDTIRWGILGTGRIADKFATALKSTPGASIMAVGSRTAASAAAFAEKFGIPRPHPTYEALAEDPHVDVIYISTPHSLHAQNTLLCLDTGKHVLCEKPMAINTREVSAMVEAARRKRLFLMEAMWTRFLPAWVRVREWLAAGAIGRPRMMTADFGFRCAVDPASRLFDPLLGGGSLLDVGVYPVAAAVLVLGRTPAAISAQMVIGTTGVDEQTALVLRYPDGALALLSSAIRTTTPHEAVILGTEGSIRIPSFWNATTAVLLRDGEPPRRIEEPFTANGYEYEAIEVGRCLRAGLTESPVMPLDETLAIAAIMDEARGQAGLRYAADKTAAPPATATRP